MNTFRKMRLPAVDPTNAPDVPVRFTPARSRARAPKVQIVNNIARNQMRRAGIETLDLNKIEADRRARLKGRPRRMSRDELNREAYLAAQSLGVRREQVWIDDTELPLPEQEMAPVVSLEVERARRAPVRKGIFNTRNAIAAAAGALLGLMASGGGVAYGLSQMDAPSKANSAQMVKATAAPQMDESARVLAEINEEPEVELTRTMDCSIPFETLGKKMDKWGGWEKVREQVAKKSHKPNVCEAHQVVKREFGANVADKFKADAVSVPETSKVVEVKKEKKSRWSMAKRVASKAKKWFGGWA